MAISRNEIDFCRCVLIADVSPWRVPAADQIDLKNVAGQACRFALDPVEPISDAKDQVCSRVLGERLEDLDAELDGLQRDCHLADRPSEIWIHREHMFVEIADGRAPEPSRMCDAITPDS